MTDVEQEQNDGVKHPIKRNIIIGGAASTILVVGAAIEEQTHILRTLYDRFLRRPTETNPNPQYVRKAEWKNQQGVVINKPTFEFLLDLQLNNGIRPDNLVAVLTVEHENQVADPTINKQGGWPIADIVPLTENTLVNLQLNLDHPDPNDNPIPFNSNFIVSVNIHRFTMDNGVMIIDPRGQLNVANYLHCKRGPAPTPQP